MNKKNIFQIWLNPLLKPIQHIAKKWILMLSPNIPMKNPNNKNKQQLNFKID